MLPLSGQGNALASNGQSHSLASRSVISDICDLFSPIGERAVRKHGKRLELLEGGWDMV